VTTLANSPGREPACIAVAAAAITPDAGPDITVATACSVTMPAETVPPLPCMTSSSRAKPRPASSFCRRSM
jgi:hypothetical protein